MSVRINRASNDLSSVKSHKELVDIGTRTHEEIDSYLAEIDGARGSDPSLGDKLNRIDDAVSQNETDLADHEGRIGDLETTSASQGNRLTLVERDIVDIREDVTDLQTVQHDHEIRLSSVETEVEQARGAEASLADRLNTLERYIEDVADQPIADLSVTNPVYQVADNSIQVTINAGRASINKIIVDKFTQFFTIPNVAANTTYYIFLHEDGSYSYSLDSTEPIDGIIIGGVDVGLSPTTSLTALDFRYFLTKGSVENDISSLDQRITDLEGTVSDHATVIQAQGDSIASLQTDFGTVRDEVTGAREDKNGVVYDALKDRLDNMQSRLELAESRGTEEHQSVFHFTSPPNSRPVVARDFTIPKYVIGSHSIEVFLDGIRVDVDDDYIEYSDTMIRFTYDIPKEARVTIIARGSIINTTSVTDYEYYPDGKVYKEIITGGINRTVEYFYDSNGEVERKEITESNGQRKSIEYQRDASGKLLREVNNGAMYYVLQGGATYDDSEVKRRLSFLESLDQDLDVVYTYYDDGAIKTEEVYMTDPTPQLLKKTSFTYNSDGTVNTETLVYDGRSVTKTYEWDATGNIKGVKIRKVVV